MPRPARRALLLLTSAAAAFELRPGGARTSEKDEPAAGDGASDLIEVFTLRTRISVPSLFFEAVRLEHHALALPCEPGSPARSASEGNGVVAVHYLPANASALLGFPDRNGSFSGRFRGRFTPGRGQEVRTPLARGMQITLGPLEVPRLRV